MRRQKWYPRPEHPLPCPLTSEEPCCPSSGSLSPGMFRRAADSAQDLWDESAVLKVLHPLSYLCRHLSYDGNLNVSPCSYLSLSVNSVWLVSTPPRKKLCPAPTPTPAQTNTKCFSLAKHSKHFQLQWHMNLPYQRVVDLKRSKGEGWVEAAWCPLSQPHMEPGPLL